MESDALRRALIVVLSILVVGLSTPVEPVRAATDAKIVVVVGPVGSSTAHYKDDARQVVAEARRYTRNVVKVFTPDATWGQVKAAAQDANVLVYFGHGNGWPSKYAPFQTLTKNGLGLDPSTGADSTRTVYYGESYLERDIRLAPNAVVLLYHLCYASGNTEPGLPVGTVADARERVDNYGAGFIGAGARAVIAEGHPAHPVTDAIRQLFTTNRTMEQLFRRAPTFHDHALGPYDAQRTPGLSYLMDPDSTAPAGFYRSIIGDLSLRASSVVSGGRATTGAAPDDFVVPGAAEVVDPGGAGIWARAANAVDPASTAPDSLRPGTRLRLISEEPPSDDGTQIFGVRVLGGSQTGFVRAAALAPRDSAPVETLTLDQSAAWLSPNDDGSNDGLVVTARLSEPATAVLKIRNGAGNTVKTLSTSGEVVRFEWDVRLGGSPIPDGEYTWTLRATDAWGNPALSIVGDFTVDGRPPVTTAIADARAGDNGWLITAPTLALTARDAMAGVRSIAWRINDRAATMYRGPSPVSADGRVTISYRATDRAGNRERWRTLNLRVDTSGPVVSLPISGKAGDQSDTWRGKVTVDPLASDAASGLSRVRLSVDGSPFTSIGADPLVVRGNGDHTIVVVATDRAGNRTRTVSAFRIDSIEPVVKVDLPAGATPTVTPNDDGLDEHADVPFLVTEPGSVTAIITDADARIVRTVTMPAVAGPNVLTWDGRDDAGGVVADGRYTVSIVARDLAGNPGTPKTAGVDVYASLTGLRADVRRFYPQDADRLARRVRTSWTLRSPATIWIEVIDSEGAVVRHGPTGRAYTAGDAAWAWDGRDDAGALVARGRYLVVVRASNGAQAASQRTTVRADAWILSTSTTTALRGRALVLSAVSVEPLASAPRLLVRQPGVGSWTVVMTHQGGARWTASLTPRKRGTAGTLTLIVKGTDIAGGRNNGRLRLPLD